MVGPIQTEIGLLGSVNQVQVSLSLVHTEKTAAIQWQIDNLGAKLSGVVTDWATRVVANGGAVPSMATQSALNTFVNSLVAAGIDSSMLSVVCFVPDNLIAAITPLFKVVGSDPWTNHGFVAGDLSVSGLKGDAVAKYLDSGSAPSTGWTLNNNGLSLYCPTITASSKHTFSAIAGGPILDRLNPNQANSNLTDYESQSNSVSPFLITPGFFSGNRVSNTDQRLYYASSTIAFSQVGFSAGAGAGLGNQTLTAFALNNQGVISNWSSNTLSFAAIHLGLTSSQSQSLFNAVQALRTALGGGFV